MNFIFFKQNILALPWLALAVAPFLMTALRKIQACVMRYTDYAVLATCSQPAASRLESFENLKSSTPIDPILSQSRD